MTAAGIPGRAGRQTMLAAGLVEGVKLQRARVRAQQAALTDQEAWLNSELSDLSALLDGLQGGQGVPCRAGRLLTLDLAPNPTP